MIALTVVIAVATAIGFGAENRMGERAELAARRVTQLMLWGLLPPVAFLNIAALELTAQVGAGIAFAYAALLLTGAIAYFVGTYLLHLPRPAVGALVLASAFANTGYLGLPFNAALFGLDSVPTAVAYDVLVTTFGILTIGFSIGAAFGTVAERPRERVAAFFARNPPLWACALGFLAPEALAPEWAVEASQIVVFAILPLGFFVVGVTLAAEAEEGGMRFPPPLTAAVGTALGLKLLVAPAIVLALSQMVLEVPDTYLVQAAMASAINGIVIAHEYGLDRGLLAAAIAWSTAVVVAAGLVVAALG
ncbi:MAG: AEC family transporter [Thermoleophilaceae bacterium]|nr:AEC family transporter [Thermoleophilaceae bacterium]